jgi:hypothetical protein
VIGVDSISSCLAERMSEKKFLLKVPQLFLAFGHSVIVSVVAKAPALWITAIFNILCAWHKCLSIFCLLTALRNNVSSAGLREAYWMCRTSPIPCGIAHNADTIAKCAAGGTWYSLILRRFAQGARVESGRVIEATR